MVEREQIRRPTSVRRDRRIGGGKATMGGESAASDQEPEIGTGLDDLLDEIDELLESNAEEFVKSYVQKGGQ